MGNKTKTYNGKKYNLASRTGNKESADTRAKMRRTQGYNARVEKEGSGYSVYTRRK